MTNITRDREYLIWAVEPSRTTSSTFWGHTSTMQMEKQKKDIQIKLAGPLNRIRQRAQNFLSDSPRTKVTISAWHRRMAFPTKEANRARKRLLGLHFGVYRRVKYSSFAGSWSSPRYVIPSPVCHSCCQNPSFLFKNPCYCGRLRYWR